MVETIRNAWKIPELRQKLIFTLFIMVVYRFANAIYVPFVDTVSLAQQFLSANSNNVLGYFNTLSGGGLQYGTVMALSIYPYINSSIVIQLLQVAFPNSLGAWAKEGGEEGKRKIARVTRLLTLGLAIVTAIGYYMMIDSYGVLTKTDLWSAVVIITTFVAGSMFAMWLGEQITENGIGNGISMILFVGIVSRGFAAAQSLLYIKWYAAIIVLVMMVAIIAFIVWITGAERKIPVQYAKRVVGRKQYGGQASTLPMKVNMSGVMPVIFASTICGVPATIAGFSGKTEGFWYNMNNGWFKPGAVAYIIIYVLLIFAFAYFYSTIQFNPIEVANNMKKNGGFIPGFRPGKPTSDFIAKVLGKITMMGAIFLAIIAALPLILSNIPSLGALGIGGTTTLIMVSVSLETVRAIEGEMMMRHYKGFLE